MDVLMPLVPKKIRNIPTHMDFEGQRKAERIFQTIIVLFAAVGFVWGYICQQFSQTVYILGAGFALSGLLTLPPWPMFRRKSLEWQKARDYNADSDTVAPAPQTSTQKSKKKK